MQAYKVMARNLKTNVRVQRQDLTRHIVRESEAQRLAQDFAQQMQLRGEGPWVAEVSTYTVNQ